MTCFPMTVTALYNLRLIHENGYLKLNTISIPYMYNRQISSLRFIALRGERAPMNVAHVQHR